MRLRRRARELKWRCEAEGMEILLKDTGVRVERSRIAAGRTNRDGNALGELRSPVALSMVCRI